MWSLIVLLVVVGFGYALWARRQYQKGTTQRIVATVAAVILGLIGLTGIGVFVFFMVAFASWGNNK